MWFEESIAPEPQVEDLRLNSLQRVPGASGTNNERRGINPSMYPWR